VTARTPPATVLPSCQRPGSATAYSDIGFILLRFVIEALCGTSLKQAAHSLIFEPLGMRETRFIPDPDDPRFVPTESFDGAPLCGVVHNRNARLLGGAAGHAGLFAPADNLASYLQPWIGTAEPRGAAN
jgi:CubicO group peptidase (beta-lactamase class C family)